MTAAELRLHARPARYLTQTELAARIVVQRRAIQYWEAGGRKISPVVERLLATLEPRIRPSKSRRKS